MMHLTTCHECMYARFYRVVSRYSSGGWRDVIVSLLCRERDCKYHELYTAIKKVL